MTPTEMYKRAESLFNERTKRELADMVVHREADLEDARAENAKLRNDADLLRSMLQAKREDTHALMSENAKLQEMLQRRSEQFDGMTEMWVERGVENAKLRELCADMLMSPQDYCEKYGIEYEGWSSADDHIDARMRELGVDDG